MARTVAGSCRKLPTPNFQTPNVQRRSLKKRSMMIVNISAALGFLFESVRGNEIGAMDENKLDAASAKAWLDWWKRVNTVLDLEPETENRGPSRSGAVGKTARETRAAKRIGSEATNCVIEFPR